MIETDIDWADNISLIGRWIYEKVVHAEIEALLVIVALLIPIFIAVPVFWGDLFAICWVIGLSWGGLIFMGMMTVLIYKDY